ncbi:MAG: adenylate/guanylate cyclase domain-containing protein [Pseudomonadota bacterium]
MIANLRLISGLVLTLFVVGHFINHALGIVSLKAMNDALKYFIQPWREPVGEAILLLALIVHAGLAFHALYQRRTLKMSLSDKAQFASGFLIPLLLGSHVIATRGIHEVYGVVEGYQFTLYGMWVGSVFYGVLNLIALPIVWFHACLGWHNWLKYKTWYQRAIPAAYAFAILLPTLALAGYISASLRVVRLSGNENWVNGLFRRVSGQVDDIRQFIAASELVIWLGVPAAILLVLLARWLRARLQSARSRTRVRYRDMANKQEKEFSLMNGASLLENIRAADISHASVCGGRGRCSTCRVRIDEGSESLSPAGASELKVLQRINATPDIRLACQIIPTGSLSVTALMEVQAANQDSIRSLRAKGGEEQDITILFADIRGFTKLSEARLPYDTAFLLNRYFAAMGKAIEDCGGHLDKFIGDGVMALFGVDESAGGGARKAVKAAIAMSEQLDALNASMKSELAEPLRIGIGIHNGPAIVGQMGYGAATGLTAIGDTVNIASRLEAMTKEHQCQLIISRKTLEQAGLTLDGLVPESVPIRGRERPLRIHAFENARLLANPTAIPGTSGLQQQSS